MAAAMSNYLAGKLLDYVLKGTAFSSPTLYAALTTTVPTQTDTGSTILEVAYTSYVRVSVPGSSINAATLISGLMSSVNGTAINFPTSTGTPQTALGFALCDALTVGNLLYFGPLTQSLAIFSGSPVVIPASDLTVTQD